MKYLHLFPILLLTLGTANATISPQAKSENRTQTVAINSTNPETIAREITVKIQAGDRRGSGTIISKKGNRYTVLTNAHVVKQGQTFRLTTADGQIHTSKCVKGCNSPQERDLAVLEFTASQNYTVPQQGDSSQLQPSEPIYSAGFPFEQQSLEIIKGTITLLTPKPLQGGYQIGYSSRTPQGMSGGPLLNANGQLIGIIGFNSQPILNDGYQYQDGSQPLAAERQQMRKSSFAIPISMALAAGAATANPPTAPTQKYTGIVKRVDDIAEQITVRIEDKEGNGSGVIVAREGNTYSVVTAAHVVENKEGYSIITPSQERIKVRAEQVTILNKDLDVALVKFTSSQNYRVAELANYQFENVEWVFVSGFPKRDTKLNRYLSTGQLMHRDGTEFIVKDKSSLGDGNNLIYTNLSLPGMSGGAILDRDGRLIGINTGAENERIINQNNYQEEEINFGYARGISASTILGTFIQGQISTSKLKVVTLPPSQLAEKDSNVIIDNLLSTLSLPSQSSTAKEWLDYGNLLWRSFQNDRAIVAFDRAIILLKRGNTNSDREQLKLAYVGKGLSLAFQKQHKEAVAAFSGAIAIDPQFIQAWHYQGRSFERLKQYEEALFSYQKAIELDPESLVFFSEQGDIFRELKRYQKAINSYSRAIQIKPKHPWAYNNRGDVYRSLRQYSQAIGDYNQAIKINPQLADTYSNRGVTYNELKQYDKAIADYNQAIKINPQLANAYYNRGIIYNELKQYDKAIADYTQAIKINPQLAGAYNNRGVTYNELKQYDKAIADYNQAIKINPQRADTYYNRGIIYNELKQYDKAIADYSQAIKINPQHSGAYHNRGITHEKLKQYDKAIADYSQAIKINPQHSGAYHNRGITHEKLEQDDKAVTDYTQSIKINPYYANVYGNRATIYQKLKQYDKAIADYNQAIKINPQLAEAYVNRGNAYKELEQYPQSISDYTQAIKINSQLAEAYANRGVVCVLQKQYSKVKTDLKKAAELFQQQGNQSGYQAVMALLQELAPLMK
jgi:tetratricopeptide (TPR) repeat protein/S1-C subfamily serine protease